MSNIIPPLLSSTPPPIIDTFEEEEEDDEFGDFRTAGDLSTCDSLSIPPTPEDSPFRKSTPSHDVDINSNNSNIEIKAFDYDDILEITIKHEDVTEKNKDPFINNLTEEELNCTNYIESNIINKEEPLKNKSLEIENSTDTSSKDPSENVTEHSSQIVLNTGDDKSCNIVNNEVNQVNDIELSNNSLQVDKLEEEEKYQVPNLLEEDSTALNQEEDLEESETISCEDDLNCSNNLLNDDSKVCESSNANEVKKIISNNLDDEDDEFGEFTFQETIPNLQEEQSTNYENDEFSDFNEYVSIENEPERIEKTETKDFGDLNSPSDNEFGDFTSNFPTEDTVSSVVNISLDSKDVLENSEKILKEMFPVLTSEDESNFMYIDLIKENGLFNELKDVTDTKALGYQWSKSSSQKTLLKSLNIDERNILYGPSWNLSVPRFAATLSTAPLEPVKSESILTPTQVSSQPNTNIPPAQEKENPTLPDIPTAQFDWNSSGLTNPLDSQLAKETSSTTGDLMQETLQTIKNLHEEKQHQEEKSDVDITTTITKPQISPTSSTIQLDNVSVKSLQFVENQTEEIENNQFNKEGTTDFEFTSFQSSAAIPEQWNNMVPLRETYISNDNEPSKQQTLEPVAWLQPTILTPVLTKKDIIKHVEQEDDDFEDFQIASSDNNTSTFSSYEDVKSNFSNDQVNILPPQFNETTKTSTRNVPNSNVIEPEIDIEDDFSNFQSSVPQVEVVPVSKPLQPVTLEPLKPTSLVQPNIFNSTQINWPNPGITEDDIRNIELSYSCSNNKTEEDIFKKEEVKIHKPKQRSFDNNDDEEWSDFVSVQEPPKAVVSFPNNIHKDRISTPDLPLSVLNLGNVQPTKTPIPVITPQGLIQTQLPSTPIQTKVVQTSVNNQMYKPMSQVMQTSTISQQFIGQLYNNNNNTHHGVGSKINFPSGSNHQTLANSVGNDQFDDDDWSDFVSAPPTTNGVQQNKQQATGWGATPHIITNPSHFESFRSFKAPSSSDNTVKNKKVINVQSRKSTIPSISAMPDLDFIAPKRTSNRK